jgi:hypothetical protein
MGLTQSSNCGLTDEFSYVAPVERGGNAVTPGVKTRFMGFRTSNFTWFPDQNTIAFIHRITLLFYAHFPHELNENNVEHYVTNCAGEEKVHP